MSYSKEENKAYLRERYHNQRSTFIAYLGGHCVKCGATEDLEFDHIEPALKSFTIAKLWPERQLDEVYKELDKCQLLCSTHHQEKTTLEHKNGTIYHPPFQHGTMYGWMKKKCGCEECTQAKTIWNTERNKTRRSRSNGTRDIYKLEMPHGSLRKYGRGCKCFDCKLANAIAAKHLRNTGERLRTDKRLM